jgi:hypothetical protein
MRARDATRDGWDAMDVRARRGCARTIAVRGSSRANEEATGGWMKKAPLEKEKRRGGEQR